jgi:hypothetical protein
VPVPFLILLPFFSSIFFLEHVSYYYRRSACASLQHQLVARPTDGGRGEKKLLPVASERNDVTR